MYCPKCGTKNDDNAYKCTKCGKILHEEPDKKKSNTAVVVLVIAGIAVGLLIFIAIVAAIAIPSFVSYRAKARDAMAQAEIKNACTAAAAFFMEHPDKTITLADLKEKGMAANPEVEVAIENGTMGDLSIRARHTKGRHAYVADRNCAIREIQP
jgi:type IV pilus assembly protein PilA